MKSPDEEELARLETLRRELATLYDNLKEPTVHIAPASFGLPGVFPGIGGPTGYASVFDKLEEARKALDLKQTAHAERLIHEAYAQFNWCKKNVGWISRGWATGAPKEVQGAPQAGSSSNWFVRLLPAPVRCLPRWVLLLLYMAAWIGVIAGVANAHSDSKLVSVPVIFLFWGTLGGATAGIFGIWIHTVRTDFDRNYVPWYIVKPLMGGIAAAVVYILGDNISPVKQQNTTAATDFTAFGNGLLLAAFVMGFFESLFISVLEIVRLKIRDVLTAALGQQEEKA